MIINPPGLQLCLTEAVNFARDGRHELGEEQVCDWPVHQGDVQQRGLEGHAHLHLRLGDRHLDTETQRQRHVGADCWFTTPGRITLYINTEKNTLI